MSSAPHVALAVAVICAWAFVVGTMSARLGQPRVIGEIAAGIVLGPTLLGALFPGLFHSLFATDLTGKLNSLARLGVILFVFFVGVEFEPALSRVRWRLIGSLVAASFVVPLLLGIAIAFPLYSRFEGTTPKHGAFVLFLGVALSITAFPVLAAILDDVGLTLRPLGQLALGTAAVTDVAAWCVLALVAADAGSGHSSAAAERLLATAGLAAGMLLVVRPLLRRCYRALPEGIMSVVYPVGGVALAIALATATERIGVSVVFGALLAGITLGARPGKSPRPLEQVRVLNRALLLPVFFAATGLRINLGSSGSVHLLGAGALVLAVVTLGKVGGVSLVARAGRLTWRDSCGLGALLNSKGLTEIVVLVTGYDLGLISRDALGILILVALVTTAATVPSLRLLGLVPPTDAATTG